MASRCPREKGNISLAGPANNPGNRTITRSPCECAHQPTPLFIDTFRAKTTDIAKREPITKSRLSLSYHAETFSLVSPRVPLILVPFFFFPFRVSSSVLPLLSSGECSNPVVPPPWRTVDPFIRKCQGRGKDGRSGGLALEVARGIYGSSAKWKKYSRMNNLSFPFSIIVDS